MALSDATKKLLDQTASKATLPGTTNNVLSSRSSNFTNSLDLVKKSKEIEAAKQAADPIGYSISQQANANKSTAKSVGSGILNSLINMLSLAGGSKDTTLPNANLNLTTTANPVLNNGYGNYVSQTNQKNYLNQPKTTKEDTTTTTTTEEGVDAVSGADPGVSNTNKDENTNTNYYSSKLSGSSGNNNASAQSNQDLSAIVKSAVESMYPTGYQNDYNFVNNLYDDYYGKAVTDVKDSGQYILNQKADNDAATLAKYVAALNRNKAIGLTTNYNAGKESADAISTLKTLNDSNTAANNELDKSVLQQLLSLASKRSDQPTAVNTTLASYTVPGIEAQSNVLGNNNYNAIAAYISSLVNQQANDINLDYYKAYLDILRNSTNA